MVAGERIYPKTGEIQSPRYSSSEIHEREGQRKEWTIKLDGYIPSKQRASEVINSLANGYMGFRASVAGSREGTHHPATYVAGLFEQNITAPSERKDQSKVPDIVHIPDFLHVEFFNGQEWYNKDDSKLLSYNSNLDMRNGVLTYNARVEDKDGRITKIKHSKFLSQDDEHVGGLSYSVTPENYSGIVTLQTGIDGQVDNSGNKYLQEEAKGETPEGNIFYTAVTKNKKHLVALSSKIEVSSEGRPVLAHKETLQEDQKIEQSVKFYAEEGHTYTLDKVISVFTSRDKGVENPLQESVERVSGAEGYEDLLERHIEKWDENWNEMDVEIRGNEDVQKVIRYNLFKLRQLAYDKDDRVSIAAKGLDNLPGEGYMGHVFWDTEIFMLPFFVNTNPEIAKSLLMYRYNTLDAAREKAQNLGYEGALYAWESADTGEEATPEWAYDKEGRLIRIYTGEKEFHISADVAYATWEYFKATNDQEFLKNYGSEIMAETAKFWASKADYNAEKDRFEIKGVIGPDEYHEKSPDGKVGVDNNFFNNVMAQWNIRKALEIWENLGNDKTVSDKMNLSADEARQMKEIADKMFIPYDPEKHVYSQFDGYFDLKDIDLARDYPGIPAMDTKLRDEGKDPTEYKIIKQADVLLGLELTHQSDPDILKANYEYYEPRCSHGSSLSDATHVISDVKTGHMEKAYDHLVKAMTIDLNDTKLNNHYGSHTAALGGTWKAVVYGFGGVEANDDSLSINPRLPGEWDGLAFNLRYKGNKIHADIRRDEVQLSLREGENSIPFTFAVGKERHILEPGGKYTFRISSTTHDTVLDPQLASVI